MLNTAEHNVRCTTGFHFGTPTLYFIYQQSTTFFKIFGLLFADDTTLLLTHSNIYEHMVMANTEFQKICEFFCVNRLVLHPDKTKFLLFTRSKIKQLNLNLVAVTTIILTRTWPITLVALDRSSLLI